MSKEVLQELEKLYRKHPPQKPDVWGRRPALPSEVQRYITPATTPEVTHQTRHTPSHKPGTQSGK